MPATVVIGAQWGDEGKGKIVDYLAQKMDMVVRFNGGPNAGHTVINERGKFALRMVPSGIFYPNIICVMGNGMVIDADKLVAEIESLEGKGVSCKNLRISNKAHLILPKHIELDRQQEESRGRESIGTTLQGIGPAYSDKAARSGRRTETLSDHFLSQYICQAEEIIWDALDKNQQILLEGAQGALLDIDFGSYPHVTSSVCTANGALQGSGVPWNQVKEVIGVVKAYMTRVGSKEQPFPSEMPEETARILREQAHEYGTVSGRPRRIGWLDLESLYYVSRLNGFTALAITRLDNLGFLPRVELYTRPVRTELPGWGSDIGHCRRFSELPENARIYINIIENTVGVPVKFISVGPARDQTIIM
jgi:adenylosuccinate synthase